MIISLIDFYRKHSAAVYIIFAGFIIRVFAATIIMPGFDEAYYGVYSFFPSMGYFDHPPIVAFTGGFGLWLSGVYNPLMLRLGAVLIFCFTSFFVYIIAFRLYGNKAAILSLLAFHLTPYFMFGMGAFVIPDNALGFFWILFLFSILEISQSSNPRWFLLSGIAFGFAMLAKYHAVFLPFGLFLLLVLNKSWRRYFKSPYPYFGFLLGLLVFLPNLIWNSQNAWITILTQFGKSASGGLNISASRLLQAVLVQAAYLLPWNMFGYIKSSLIAREKRGDPGAWLLPFIFPTIIVFTLIGATRQILPHWPMPGYLGAIIISGHWLANLNRKKRRFFLGFSLYTSAILISFILLQSISGFVPIKRHADLTLDGQGWKDVISYLERNESLTPQKNFLIAHKWFTGGEIAFAGGNKYNVAVFNQHSPHGFAYWVNDDKIRGETGYFITSERYPFDPREELKPFFKSITAIDTIATYRISGKEAQRFFVFECNTYSGGFPYFYGPGRGN